MAKPLVYSNELEAVNTMLRYVDEQPVNAIPTSGVTPASIAAQELHETSREVQSEGLEFNTEIIELVPDTNENIVIPKTYLRIDPIQRNRQYVQRGLLLYDKTENRFEIKSKVKCEIVIFFAFDDVPEVVRRFITVRAGRKFIQNLTGEVNLKGMADEDEQAARENLVDQQINVGDHNFLQSLDMRSALHRSIQPFHNTH